MRQRHTLTTYYLVCRMKLHLTFITNQDAFQFLGVYGPAMTRKRSRGICVGLAMDLIRLQCDVHDSMGHYRAEQGLKEAFSTGGSGTFERCWSLFDAAVTLICVLTQHPSQDRPSDAEAIITRTIGVFSRMLQPGVEEGSSSDIARIAVEVLNALAQEPGWKTTTSDLRDVRRPSGSPPVMVQESFNSQPMFHSPSAYLESILSELSQD